MDLAIPSGDELDVLLREEAAWRTAAHSAELETSVLRSTMTGPPYHPAAAAIAEPYPVAETYYRAVPYTAAAQAAETAAARVRWATGQREPPPSVYTRAAAAAAYSRAVARQYAARRAEESYSYGYDYARTQRPAWRPSPSDTLVWDWNGRALTAALPSDVVKEGPDWSWWQSKPEADAAAVAAAADVAAAPVEAAAPDEADAGPQAATPESSRAYDESATARVDALEEAATSRLAALESAAVAADQRSHRLETAISGLVASVEALRGEISTMKAAPAGNAAALPSVDL